MDLMDSVRPSQDRLGRGAALKAAVTEAYRLLDSLVAADMAELGLSVGEADVLTVIRVCDYDPVPGEIAEWLGLTGAGTTGRLNTLERRGLIERRTNPRDRRSVTLHLTELGADLAAQVLDAKDSAIISGLVDRVGRRKIDGLIAELNLLIVRTRETLTHR